MLNMKAFYISLGVMGVASFTVNIYAATLYATSAAGGPGELFILDPATGGMVQDIGPLNDSGNTNYPVTGLAFDPTTGVLYGSTANSVAAVRAKLITINPTNAEVTVIGDFNVGNQGGNPATMADIAFDVTGSLYGIGSVAGPQLYSINIHTGQATSTGDSGLTGTSGGGLAISAAGVFYGTPNSDNFGTYNPSTGQYSNITNPFKPLGGSYAALSFDGGDVLFGLNLGPNSGGVSPTHLVTINPETGAVFDIGASLNAIDAIAFRPPHISPYIVMASPMVTNGYFSFSWNTVSNDIYHVQFKQMLTDSTWIDLTNITASGDSVFFGEPLSQTQRFYRISQ